MTQADGGLLKASLLYGISAASGKALALLTIPFLTRTLGADGYGLADLATSTAALLTLIVQFSGDIPTARRAANADGPGRRELFTAFVWTTGIISIGVSAALLPASPAIADDLWRGGTASSDLAVLSLALVPLSAVQAALTQVQRIASRSGRFALLSAIDLLAQLGLAVMFVAIGFGPAGVLLGFVVGSVIGLSAAAFAARGDVGVRPNIRLGISLAREGIPFLPYLAAFIAADWLLRPILAASGGAALVGAFGVAVRVASILSLVGTAFAMAWGPHGLGRDRSAGTAKDFRRTLLAYGSISIALAVAVGAAGPELTALIAGPGFSESEMILPGLALTAAVAGSEYILVVSAGITASGTRVAMAAVTGAVLQVTVAIVLIPSLGASGAGSAALIGRMVSFGILAMTVRRFLGLGPIATSAAGLIVASAAVVLWVILDGQVDLARYAIVLSGCAAAAIIGLRTRRSPDVEAV